MRLLVVNPNTSDAVTGLIRAEAVRSASSGTEIVAVTAPYGVEYIETRLEALLAGGAVAQAIAEEPGPVDGVVVAAFGDPGMPALKELVDVPVVGITEAAVYTAAMQGTRFSVIAITQRIQAWYRECIEMTGLGARLASIRTLTTPLRGIGSVQDDFSDPLLQLAAQAVAEDGADAVILAGAPLAGLARTLADRLPVPVVDGVSAGVGQCELLVALGGGTHRAGSFARPPAKPNKGLPVAIARALTTDTTRRGTP